MDQLIVSFKTQQVATRDDCFTNCIRWEDGLVLEAAREGSPFILDSLNAAKAQVVECLNPLLEGSAQ